MSDGTADSPGATGDPSVGGSASRDAVAASLFSGVGRRVPLFDDRVSRALFLGAICWFALTWRVGFFISDTYAVANTLVNVADGHLYISHIQYSLSLGSSQPGLHLFEGRVYGRNYGQVYLAIPLYWLLEGAAVVVDLRIAITGVISLALLGCAQQVGGLLDRRSSLTILGSVMATLFFLANLLWARSIDPHWSGLLALQGTMLIAGGVLAVVVYRLFRSIADRRVGAALGVFVVAATPVGFWATVPKRHVLTAALTMAVLYGFYLSRSRTDGTGRWARAGAYAAAGWTASVHGGEGAVLLALLLPMDLLTAPSNARRPLGIAAAGMLAGIAPFLVTNTLISGNPFLAPRWLRSFNGGSIGPGGTVQVAMAPLVMAAGIAGSGGVWMLGSAGTGSDGTVVLLLGGLWEQVLSFLRAAWEYGAEGLAAATDLDRLYHVFLRSGRIEGVRYQQNEYEVIELAMLESMPIGGALLGVLAVGRQRVSSWIEAPGERVRSAVTRLRTDPVRQTDALALALLAGLTIPYLPRLPLFSQITVRYLLPTMPLWLYFVGRLGPVQRALSEHLGYAVWSYLLGVTAGGLAMVSLLGWLDVALGEAMQFHALVNLALAGTAGVTIVVGDRFGRPDASAVALGIVAAATTVLLALAGIEYFAYSEPLLPLTRLLEELLALF